MNQLDFVSDNLLSTNDSEVIAKKRENFKWSVTSSIKNTYKEFDIKWNDWIDGQIVDAIVENTFDAGVVN